MAPPGSGKGKQPMRAPARPARRVVPGRLHSPALAATCTARTLGDITEPLPSSGYREPRRHNQRPSQPGSPRSATSNWSSRAPCSPNQSISQRVRAASSSSHPTVVGRDCLGSHHHQPASPQQQQQQQQQLRELRAACAGVARCAPAPTQPRLRPTDGGPEDPITPLTLDPGAPVDGPADHPISSQYGDMADLAVMMAPRLGLKPDVLFQQLLELGRVVVFHATVAMPIDDAERPKTREQAEAGANASQAGPAEGPAGSAGTKLAAGGAKVGVAAEAVMMDVETDLDAVAEAEAAAAAVVEEVVGAAAVGPGRSTDATADAVAHASAHATADDNAGEGPSRLVREDSDVESFSELYTALNLGDGSAPGRPPLTAENLAAMAAAMEAEAEYPLYERVRRAAAWAAAEARVFCSAEEAAAAAAVAEAEAQAAMQAPVRRPTPIPLGDLTAFKNGRSSSSSLSTSN
ncbi:hypothetical protein KEM52_001191 [Ascosphaera acerosa]|nr:hypothetical protein KEM52_001191 [Ascosphaera acerosa]